MKPDQFNKTGTTNINKGTQGGTGASQDKTWGGGADANQQGKKPMQPGQKTGKDLNKDKSRDK